MRDAAGREQQAKGTSAPSKIPVFLLKTAVFDFITIKMKTCILRRFNSHFKCFL